MASRTNVSSRSCRLNALCFIQQNNREEDFSAISAVNPYSLVFKRRQHALASIELLIML
jgi:hypothetical protein